MYTALKIRLLIMKNLIWDWAISIWRLVDVFACFKFGIWHLLIAIPFFSLRKYGGVMFDVAINIKMVQIINIKRV